MIKYMLQCRHSHVFEVWFSKGSDFDIQSKQGLLSCPNCADQDITKAPMAPNIRISKSTSALAVRSASMDQDMIEKCRDHIEKNFEDVGHDFADEAKAMHYGETEKRPIYGQTSGEQQQDLADEGIETMPLPTALVPVPKKKIN